jgi:hypothetical protein
MTGPNGQALQAVCASPDLANRLEEPIRLLKKFTPDKKFYLKRFGNPEIIKTL